MKVAAFYPKGSTKRTNIRLTREQAIELAAKMLAVAADTDAQGDIYITGSPDRDSIAVVRKKI